MTDQHILVVDDELILLMEMEGELSSAGYVVHSAANALAAFEALQRHPEIEVVVTDVQMPGSGDGRALAQYIRAVSPSVPIIVVSGTEVDLAEMPSSNVVVMSKPFEMDKLIEAIRQVAPPSTAIDI